MGGKYKSRRHPGILYTAGLILILLSGCARLESKPPGTGSEKPDWQAYLAASEQLIKDRSFDAAKAVADQMATEIQADIPPDHSWEDTRLRLLKIQQALLEQILTFQARQRFLLDRMDRNWETRQQSDQTMAAMKKRITDLNKKIQRLEQDKKRLEKQIERMKQIDLN